MCLVEVDKVPKALPACATPVTPGMKIFTKSSKALAAQKAVMEFLLINHPLDCPICDQGGECELQDLSMGYGAADSYYSEGKRVVKDKEIGPLISTDMTRCIQCTRCVRFGAEVAGMRELGATGRGEHMEIGTYIEHAMESEISGNVIDICPVGALTSKPFRFTARAWELEQRPTVSPHDCLGSNLNAHMRTGKVMRMVPRENKAINQTWISDRDRFSYESLYHPDRVKQPLIKKAGRWQTVDWQTALEFAATGLQKVWEKNGAENMGALASPNATVEEFYLLQKLMRGLGSPHIDHRLRQVDFSDQDVLPAYPSLGMSVAALAEHDVILLVGSHIQKDQPMASVRIRQAARLGAKILALNAVDEDFHFDLTEKEIVIPDEMVVCLARIAKALLSTTHQTVADELTRFLSGVEITDVAARMAAHLQQAKKACLILGNAASHFPQAALIRSLCEVIATLSGAQCGVLTDGANSAGAWLAGAIPHRGMAQTRLSSSGLNAYAMLQTPRQAYVLLNVEPDVDCANAAMAVQALQQADFVVSLSIFRNARLDESADVILPIAPFTETAGTFVNAAGEWQSFNGVAAAYEEARPAWKVLRVLGNMLQLDGFDYVSPHDICREVKSAVDRIPASDLSRSIKLDAQQLKLSTSHLQRIGTIPLYAVDSLVRRANALQAAQPILENNTASVRIHPELARDFQLEEGCRVTVKQAHGQAYLPVVWDTRLPKRGVMISGGIPETSDLGELFGVVDIQK
jgi:NADH-quinone oxidoreductase subunit G